MKKSWKLGFLLLGLLALGFGGCKKKNTQASSLMAYIPLKNNGVLIVRRLKDIPQKLEALLQGYEGKEGQGHMFLQGYSTRLGIDPLKTQSLQDNGFAPNGMMLATRAKLNGHKVGIVVTKVKDATKFKKWLRGMLTNQLLAKTFTATRRPSGTITTAYRINRKKESVELAAYSFQKGVVLIVWSFEKASSAKNGSLGQENLKMLEMLLKQGPKASLQTDKKFHLMLKDLGQTSQLMVYVPNQGKDAKPTKGQTKQLGQRLRVLQRKNRFLSKLPLGQIGKMLQNNPITEGTVALSFGQQGISVQTLLPLPKVALAPIKSTVPMTGSAKTLLKALHKDSILTIKTGIEPKMIPMYLGQLASNLKLKPKQLNALLAQHTGLDLEKDILPVGTGHVMLSLYQVNVSLFQQVLRGHLFALTRMFGISVVAEIKNPKMLQATLEKLSKKLKIGKRTVTSTKTKDGIRYSIPAWPGTVAHWTSYGNYFIYSIGQNSMNRTISAIKDATQRLFKNDTQAGPFAESSSSALHLDLNNLRGLLRQLPFMQRATVGLILASYNVDKLDSVILSAQAGDAHIKLQGEIKLQAMTAPKGK